MVAFWLLVDLGKKRKKIIRIINKTVMRYACVSSRRGQLRKETGANRRLSRVTWPDMRRQAQTRDKKALLESGIIAHPVNGEPRKRAKAESFSEISLLLYFPATRTKSLLKRLLIEDIKFCPLQSVVIVFSSLFLLKGLDYGTDLCNKILCHRVKVCAKLMVKQKSLFIKFTCRASTASLMTSIHPSKVALNIRYN